MLTIVKTLSWPVDSRFAHKHVMCMWYDTYCRNVDVIFMTSVNIFIVCRNIKWAQWAVIEGLCGNAWLTINVYLITRNNEIWKPPFAHIFTHIDTIQHRRTNVCICLCLIHICVAVCNSHSWLHPDKDPSWRAVMSVIYIHPSFFPASITVSNDAIPPSKVIFTLCLPLYSSKF